MLKVASNAEQIQKDLLSKGFLCLKSCDIEDTPTSEIMHYSLETELGKEMEHGSHRRDRPAPPQRGR